MGRRETLRVSAPGAPGLGGRVLAFFTGRAWAATETMIRAVGGHTSYAPLNTRWDASRPYDLHDGNWRNSPFHGIAGLDIPTARSLLAAGFSVPEITRAGRDVERISRHFGSHAHLFATPENIERATRLSHAAPGFMAQVNRYAGALAGIREAEAGIAQRRSAPGRDARSGRGNFGRRRGIGGGHRRRREEAARQRLEAQTEMNEAVRALPETSTGPNGQTIRPRQDGQGLMDSVGRADAAATAEAARLRLEAAEKAKREAEARVREEAAAKEAAEAAKLAEAMGEGPPTKTSRCAGRFCRRKLLLCRRGRPPNNRRKQGRQRA